MGSFTESSAAYLNFPKQETELTPEAFRTLYFDKEFILRFTNRFGMLLSVYTSRDFKNNCPAMSAFVDAEIQNPNVKYKPALELFKTTVACPKTFRHLLMCLQNIA